MRSKPHSKARTPTGIERARQQRLARQRALSRLAAEQELDYAVCSHVVLQVLENPDEKARQAASGRARRMLGRMHPERFAQLLAQENQMPDRPRFGGNRVEFVIMDEQA